MSEVVSQLGDFVAGAAVVLGWWFALSLVVAIVWSVFHMRLNANRTSARPAPQSARLRLVVPRPTTAPESNNTPSRPAA
ncbi:MAG: hypothetical protein V9F00_10760 [Nocardioides sp.]